MSGATLVVGLGHPDRGDDGVGPAVARVVAAHLPPDARTRVVVHGDPTALLDLWEGHDHVVVVDAVVTGLPPGTLHRVDLGSTVPRRARRTGEAGTHGLGVVDVVELGRALHRVPARVVVVGVEAGCLDVGTGLTAPVAAAVDEAAAVVRAEVTADVPG
jgi:hydrogenase maturation protease